MKRIVAIFLLMLNSLVVIPTNLWHHCEHASDVNHSHNQSASENNDCAICDHTFSTSFVFSSTFLPVTTEIQFATWTEFASKIESEPITHSLGRAPPATA